MYMYYFYCNIIVYLSRELSRSYCALWQITYNCGIIGILQIRVATLQSAWWSACNLTNSSPWSLGTRLYRVVCIGKRIRSYFRCSAGPSGRPQSRKLWWYSRSILRAALFYDVPLSLRKLRVSFPQAASYLAAHKCVAASNIPFSFHRRGFDGLSYLPR